jgi:rubrerythrin
VECIPEEDGLGGHFVRAAALEAVSVLAFRQLQSELRARGARRSLLSALSRAARDERRHTRATRALARRFGGKPSEPSPLEKREVSLEAIATENVVEGCVREAYGAAIATWQAREARDPVVRAAMQRIAREETRHAALGHQLQRWLDQRLEPSARRRVEAAKRRAIAELRDAIEVAYEPGVAAVAGLPSVPRARALFAELERALWS